MSGTQRWSHNKLDDWSQQNASQKAASGGGVVRRHADSRGFVCGWGAANVNILLTFPINKVMFRQQLYGISARSAMRQLKKEGARHLYRGVLPPLLQKTTSLAIMFGMYDEFQGFFEYHTPAMPTVVNKATSAVLAGCMEAFLTPFERVQVLLQDKHKHKLYRNTVHAFSELRSFGITEYFRGLVPILIRNGPSNAVFFLLRERIKTSMPAPKNRTTEVAQDFVCGGIIGTLISTMFFPVNVIKTKMQAQVGGPLMSVGTAFREVLVERNYSWSGMFRGVHVNYTRSLLSWGVINASYEALQKLIYDN